MTVRQVEIHHGETQNHNYKIENAQPRSTRATPASAPRKLQINDVKQEHQQGDNVLRIVKPELPSEAIDPDKSERGTDGNGDQPDQYTGAAHALEQIKRRQAPHHFAKFAVAEKTI